MAFPIPPAIYPLINGVKLDWSSVEIIANGILYSGVKEISYKHGLKPKKVRGPGHAAPIGRTRGNYEASGSISFYKQDYQFFIDGLSVQGLALAQGYMEVDVVILVSYSELSYGLTITDSLFGCRLTESSNSGTDNEDPQVVKCELDIMYLSENGDIPVQPNSILQFGQ